MNEVPGLTDSASIAAPLSAPAPLGGVPVGADELHGPDILDFIADLSNDEILTPPKVVNRVLDLLPVAVWTDPSLRWLDPACKSGAFLREVAKRLFHGDDRPGFLHQGLKGAFPDEADRREHIFKNMLHGIALTELTAMESRRTLYYTKDPTHKKYAAAPFSKRQPGGLIDFDPGLDHSYEGGSCHFCGSPEGSFDGEGRERHAYGFIHRSAEEIEAMKFDVVIGNPPYQLRDGGGGASAMPIYQLFVEQAFRLKPRYVSMIIPSRWFAGGKGLDAFRERMLASTHFRHLVDHPDATEIFPGVKIEGGVCYFLWDVTYDGPCHFVLMRNDGPGPAMDRFLGEHGEIFIRFNEALPIIERVTANTSRFLDESVSTRRPFGIGNDAAGGPVSTKAQSVRLYSRSGTTWISPLDVKANHALAAQWKVMTSKAGQNVIAYPNQIIGRVFVGAPDSVCTESYLVAGAFNTQSEADNLASSLRTRFVRFLIAMRMSSHNLTQSTFAFVPVLDMSRAWSDVDLYRHFQLSQDEVRFVESIAKEMGPSPDEPKAD